MSTTANKDHSNDTPEGSKGPISASEPSWPDHEPPLGCIKAITQDPAANPDPTISAESPRKLFVEDVAAIADQHWDSWIKQIGHPHQSRGLREHVDRIKPGPIAPLDLKALEAIGQMADAQLRAGSTTPRVHVARITPSQNDEPDATTTTTTTANPMDSLDDEIENVVNGAVVGLYNCFPEVARNKRLYDAITRTVQYVADEVRDLAQLVKMRRTGEME